MKSRLILLVGLVTISLVSLCGKAGAQEIRASEEAITINGSIRYAGTDIPAICYVIVSRTDCKAAIGYTSTDDAGNYTLRISTDADSLELSISAMNILTVRKTVPCISSRQDFEVRESALEIKGAKIRASKITLKGQDTISYNVTAFRNEEDLTIEDVLKKLPGISVRKSGQILYNQKPISGLTIDGMDLLKGKYGIATRNISPDHIASVEILENHQAIKALQDLVPSDKTYINLKLKSSSRGTFILSAGAGGGYGGRGLWSAGIAPMYFGHKSQHILTGKSNNTGEDLGYELQDFSYAAGALNPILSSIGIPSPPDIDKEKYYFNTSHSASLNDLFRTKRGTDITLNLSYLHDDEIRNSAAETIWMLPDSTVNVIQEDLMNRLWKDKFNVQVGVKSNQKKLYLKNQNSFSGDISGIHSSTNDVLQDFDMNSYKASTRTDIISRSGEKTAFNIRIQAAYEHTPYRLSIASEDTDLYDGAMQNAVSDAFEASLLASSIINLKFGGFTFEPYLQARYRMSLLRSELTLAQNETAPLDSESLSNDLELHRLKIAPTARLSYSSLHFDFNVNVPLSWYMTFMDDHIKVESTLRNRFFVEPYLDMKIKFSASSDMNINYGLNYMMPEISTLYEGVVLRNYRSLSKYVSDLTEGVRNNFSVSFRHKNVFHMFFMNARVNYNLSRPKVLYGYDFNGIYSTSITHESEELSHSIGIGMEFGKSFYWKDLSLKLDLGAYFGNNPFLRQETVFRARYQSYSASLNLSFSPFRFLGVRYDGDVMYSVSRQDSGENLEPLLSNTNKLTLNFRLPYDIGLEISGDHYYSNAPSENRSFVLLDAGISYKWKKLRWELSCRNLLDTQEYVYTNMSAGSSYSSTYFIRPRSFLLKMFIFF